MGEDIGSEAKDKTRTIRKRYRAIDMWSGIGVE